MIDALETALDEVDSRDLDRRVRLLASLAVELMSSPDGPPRAADLVADAVELARGTHDPALLAQTLLVQLMVLDVPGNRREQIAIADEVLGLASQG